MTKYSIIIFLIFAFYAGNAFSQIIPSTSAGVIDRQIEQLYDAKKIEPEKEIPLLEVDVPEQQLKVSDGETVYVKKVVFEGNCEISSKTLNKCIRSHLDKNLSMKEINEIKDCVRCFYVKEGYFLARTYCPPQEIHAGVLKICILEGKLGDICVTENEYYKTSFIKGYFEKFIGKPLNYTSLMRALFLVNENLKLEVGSVLKKGKKFGTVDLILQVKDKRPITLYLDENNYGSLFTTKWRTGAKLEIGNCFTNGATLTTTQVMGNPPHGLYFSLYEYKIPVTKNGTIVDLSYLYSRFKVRRVKELRLKGRSDIFSLGVTQAIYRTKTLDMDAFTSFDYKQIKNFSLGDMTSFDKLRVWTLGFYFDYIDLTKGRTYIDADMAVGIPGFLGGLHGKDTRCSRLGAGGEYVIWHFDGVRLQQVIPNHFIYCHLYGQVTGYKLPLAEQIYIGGMPTVRGYRLANALGDKGYYLNIEYRMALPFIAEKTIPWVNKKWKEFFQILGFYDHGHVYLTGGQTYNQRSSMRLKSVGFGFRLYGPYNFNVTLDVGFPLIDRGEGTQTYFKIFWQI